MKKLFAVITFIIALLIPYTTSYASNNFTVKYLDDVSGLNVVPLEQLAYYYDDPLNIGHKVKVLKSEQYDIDTNSDINKRMVRVNLYRVQIFANMEHVTYEYFYELTYVYYSNPHPEERYRCGEYRFYIKQILPKKSNFSYNEPVTESEVLVAVYREDGTLAGYDVDRRDVYYKYQDLRNLI